MDYYELRDLLDYAERHSLMDKPFKEVYDAWQKEFNEEIKLTLESWEADNYNSSMEAHDIPYLDCGL